MINKYILNFKEKVEKENLLESICLSDKNGIIWQEQYIPRTVRNIYSHSKSFTSLMVGIAIDESMFNLETRLVDIFKEELDENTYSRLYNIKVKHLLMMSSGFNQEFLMSGQRKQGMGYPDYLKFLFSQELKEEPGTKFCYSNGDTYLLARIVEKVYGRPFTQICYEKLFKPLDIGYPMWGADPMGYCIAASELCISVEEMNRLGILCFNNGVYNGRRVVSEEYIKMCSKPQIDTGGKRDDYSFQFWLFPNTDIYRADGAYGQWTIIFPKHDLTLSFQRYEDDGINRVRDIFVEEVLNKL